MRSDVVGVLGRGGSGAVRWRTAVVAGALGLGLLGGGPATQSSDETPFSAIDTFVRSGSAEDLKALRKIVRAEPHNGAALHGLAVMLLVANKPGEASPLLQQASGLKSFVQGDDFTFNRALADSYAVAGAQRATGVLVKFLKANPAFINEDYVDVLGLSLDKIEHSSMVSAGKMGPEARALLNERIAAIEAARNNTAPPPVDGLVRGNPVPNSGAQLHKWGAKWMDAGAYDGVMRSIADATRHAGDLKGWWDRANTEMKNFESAIMGKSYPGNSYGASLRTDDNNHLADLRNRDRDAKKAWQDAVAAIPRPDWTRTFTPKWGEVDPRALKK